MSTKTIISGPFTLALPGATKPLYFKTETKFTPDKNGNPIAGTSETTLLYQITPGGVDTQAATSTDGGKAGSWTLKTDGDGNNILGATAIQSLQTPNGVLNQQAQQSIISAATKEGIIGGYQIPLANKLKNTATEPPASPGASPGASPSESKLDPALFNKAITDGIKGKTIRTNYGSLRYPQDIDNTQSDLIKFTMKSYGTRGFDPEKLKLAPKRNFGEILGSATLSIQPRISDQNTVTWNDSKMDPISMGLANASLEIIENGFNGAVSGLDKLGNTIKSERGNIETAMKMTLAQEAAKTQNLLSRLTGAVLNPNLELLFESPNLRTFNYSFQLSPRDNVEAKQVQSIIRFFKQGMAPQRTDSELFLKAPNVFDIQYLRTTVEGVRVDHPYINKVKGPCALVNCSVDYTPNGSYMTFAEDGSMVTYNLSLIFSELEPIYEDDYDSNENIGY